MKNNRNYHETGSSLRKLTVIGILSAVAWILQVAEFGLPIVPDFLKFDFSDFPAVLAAFSLGPVSGIGVELIKNLLHLPFTHTSGVGELANFLVGIGYVIPCGLIYRHKRTFGGAAMGAFFGALFAGIISFPVNYFITYPFYVSFYGMPISVIVKAYSVIYSGIDTLPKALLFVNLPFTVVKGLVSTGLTFLVYKRLSPVLNPK